MMIIRKEGVTFGYNSLQQIVLPKRYQRYNIKNRFWMTINFHQLSSSLVPDDKRGNLMEIFAEFFSILNLILCDYYLKLNMKIKFFCSDLITGRTISF